MMTPADIRQHLHQQIDQLPSDFLQLAAEFLESLKSKSVRGDTLENVPSVMPSIPNSSDGEPVLTGSTGTDLLQFSGSWQGDDFEDCLKAVYETRSTAEF